MPKGMARRVGGMLHTTPSGLSRYTSGTQVATDSRFRRRAPTHYLCETHSTPFLRSTHTSTDLVGCRSRGGMVSRTLLAFRESLSGPPSLHVMRKCGSCRKSPLHVAAIGAVAPCLRPAVTNLHGDQESSRIRVPVADVSRRNRPISRVVRHYGCSQRHHFPQDGSTLVFVATRPSVLHG